LSRIHSQLEFEGCCRTIPSGVEVAAVLLGYLERSYEDYSPVVMANMNMIIQDACKKFIKRNWVDRSWNVAHQLQCFETNTDFLPQVPLRIP